MKILIFSQLPMTKNIYNEYVEVTSDLDIILKKCFMNHLVIYNHSLGLLYNNSELNFKSLMKSVSNYITDKSINPILQLPLMSELYYQYKKFKRNIRIQKLVTDIQYFTFLCNGYECKNLLFNKEKDRIQIQGFIGEIKLPKPLPSIPFEQSIYLNLSYSNIEDKYKLSVYRAN